MSWRIRKKPTSQMTAPTKLLPEPAQPEDPAPKFRETQQSGMPANDPDRITYAINQSAHDLAVYVTFRVPQRITQMMMLSDVITELHHQLLTIFAKRGMGK